MSTQGIGPDYYSQGLKYEIVKAPEPQSVKAEQTEETVLTQEAQPVKKDIILLLMQKYISVEYL